MYSSGRMLTASVEYYKDVALPGRSSNLDLQTIKLEMTPVEEDHLMQFKSVIFVVDVSTSMFYTLETVKASLLAFRDVVIGRKLTQASSAADDELFRRKCHVELIVFNEKVKHVWSSKTTLDLTFESAVTDISVGGQTNMGDALKLAFSKCETDRVSWIVVLTDGLSNHGSCQTLASFTSLAESKPANSKIISLGYGNRFDPNILMAIGDFTFLEDEEQIALFVGSLWHEVSNSKFFNVSIEEGPEKIIGTHKIGTLFNERKVVFGTIAQSSYPVKFSFLELTTSGPVQNTRVCHPSIEVGKTLSIDVMNAYYSSETARYTDMIYRDAKASVSDKATLENIKESVKKWTDQVSIQYREQILRLIERLYNSTGDLYRTATISAASLATAAKTQSSYTNKEYMTPKSVSTAKKTLEYARTHQ